MERKDKIFFVVYVGVKGIDSADVPAYCGRVGKAVRPANDPDTSVEFFIIPTYETDETRIECLNPVLLTEDQYKAVEDKYKTYEVAIDEFLNNKHKEK